MSLDVGHSRIDQTDWVANGLNTELNAVHQNSQVGFSLGTVFRFRMHPNLHLVPQAIIAFQGSRIDYDLVNDADVQEEIEPVALEFPLHLEFSKGLGTKARLSSILGARYQRDFSKRADGSTLDVRRNDVALDVGLGLAYRIEKFNFQVQPQLMFSWGLLNLNGSENTLLNAALSGLRQDRISFRMVFFG